MTNRWIRYVAGALCISAALLCTNSAAEDQAPAEIAAFASGEWSIESFVYGDLSGHKTKDAAILIALDPEHAFGAAQDRKLVIVTRDSSGKLKKVAEGRDAIPLGAGPAGGDPELSIERNSVIVSQFGGSREKGTDRYQYKNIGGSWRLIGFRSEWYDSLNEDIPTSKTDVNFLTNYVEASWSNQKNARKTSNFYEILSVVGTPPASGVWSAPLMVLKGARVQSFHDAKRLYLLINVSDATVLPEDNVTLLDPNLKAITPLSRMRTMVQGGYQERLTFDLHKAPFADSVTGRAENSFLPLTLRIIGKTKDSAKTITSAVGAKGVPSRGGLLITSWKSSPTLSTVNVRDGNVHPLVFDF